jgi:hypothetical protein
VKEAKHMKQALQWFVVLQQAMVLLQDAHCSNWLERTVLDVIGAHHSELEGHQFRSNNKRPESCGFFAKATKQCRR